MDLAAIGIALGILIPVLLVVDSILADRLMRTAPEAVQGPRLGRGIRWLRDQVAAPAWQPYSLVPRIVGWLWLAVGLSLFIIDMALYDGHEPWWGFAFAILGFLAIFLRRRVIGWILFWLMVLAFASLVAFLVTYFIFIPGR